MIIVDDNSKEENINKIMKIINKSNLNIKFINHKNEEHKNVIKKQSNEETFSNLSSLLKCFEIGKKEGKDFAPAYIGILSAGGSKKTEKLLDEFGMDISKQKFLILMESC